MGGRGMANGQMQEDDGEDMDGRHVRRDEGGAAADAEAKKKIKTLTRTDFLIQFLWKPVAAEALPEDPEERKAKLEEQDEKVKQDVKDWIDKMTEAEKQKENAAVKVPSMEEIEAASKQKTSELDSAIEKAVNQSATPAAPGARRAGRAGGRSRGAVPTGPPPRRPAAPKSR